MPAVPLSQQTQAQLKAKYEASAGEGKTDDDINAELSENLPAIILFNQIDEDRSGAIDKKELKKCLMSMPKKKPVEPEGGWPEGGPPKFVPFDEIVDSLDTDKDDQITLEEWLANLSSLPGLKMAITGALDAETGKITGYVSLEQRLDNLLAEKAKIESEIDAIRGKIGSAGITVFRQIDIDHDGTVSQKELLRVLKVLPRPKGVKGPKVSIEDLAATLDVNGDGAISEDEWIAQIDALPALKASIEEAIDPATGKIIGYRSLEQQLWKLQKNVTDLEARIAGGEEGLEEELEKRKKAAQKLVDKGIQPEAFEEEEAAK
ncbi:hypothetical protein TrVE_jg10536 [Triparma verrucosa]|uniref:EF-hand domain-containing protein n=1 Tax=Triparma verrucosa TaxID=1606542 RepID=A0A9W7KX90_9STRA|nr:hypothetical protein TrVE_jg10536 [Triparma verrucosa]